MRTFALRDHLRTEQLIHDIRCPLSAIRGYAQLLRYRLANDRASAADVEDGLRRIVESAKRVDDLLDLLPGSSTPWISAGVRREPTELVQLARRVAADCEAAYGGRSPVVVLSDVAELVGWLDAVRLERMLANLISNALKYNRDGRPVIVTLQRDGDLAVLSVADQGIGIPAEELPRVFERGYRASNVASAADGLGLGLAGAKETVTELRGTIEVESQESVGTTVTVRLPLGDRSAGDTIVPSRNELIERLEALEQQLRDLRREVIGEDSDPNARHFRALRFIKAFYDEPGQRILWDSATRAATEAGYDAAALAGFYTGTQPVLRSDGDWRVLTPAGKQWYEERALMLLSRSE